MQRQVDEELKVLKQKLVSMGNSVELAIEAVEKSHEDGKTDEFVESPGYDVSSLGHEIFAKGSTRIG